MLQSYHEAAPRLNCVHPDPPLTRQYLKRICEQVESSLLCLYDTNLLMTNQVVQLYRPNSVDVQTVDDVYNVINQIFRGKYKQSTQRGIVFNDLQINRII